LDAQGAEFKRFGKFSLGILKSIRSGLYLMTNNFQSCDITSDLARKLIIVQFPEYAHLFIQSVEKQGHDNRTYRLGNDMLIRMPSADSYALKVPKEQDLLPKLAPYLTVNIPVPLKMGNASDDYPYPFSIYKWLEGVSVNLLILDDDCLEKLAFDLAQFLKELQNINNVDGPKPGQHNWWRGDHVSVYDKGARAQIEQLSKVIDATKAMQLWENACKTRWVKKPVWIHGDFAIGNMLMKDGKLSAIIDFGGMSLGDPACDLVIAWTFLQGKARDIFINTMDLDADTWLRAKAWALWKATFELCQIKDK
jgi:aminoglycoside phosphotransferase (APT) family kinase protein